MSRISVEVDPAEVGLDRHRLIRLDNFLGATMSAGRIPGWLVAVARHGRVAHLAMDGYREVDARLPVEADTVFRIYSMTKPITNVAAMILYERGDFELADPVHRYIPSFRDMRVFTGGSDFRPVTEPAGRPIQIRHLMTHTAGLTYGFHHAHPVDAMYRQAGHELEAPAGLTLAEACDSWAAIPLLFQPGAEWNYSVASDVLGRVVEVISGQSLGQFFSEQIFQPLGMTDTGFGVTEQNSDRLARLYVATPTGGISNGDEIGATALRAPTAHYGGGGLVSTATDYLRFAQMLLGRGTLGDVRILGPRTVDFMTRNHLPGNRDLQQFGRPLNAESPLAGIGQGLGMSVVLDPVRAGFPTSAGEFGWGGAASTVFWVDPALQLTVVFMTQLLPSHALPIRSKLHELVHQALTD